MFLFLFFLYYLVAPFHHLMRMGTQNHHHIANCFALYPFTTQVKKLLRRQQERRRHECIYIYIYEHIKR